MLRKLGRRIAELRRGRNVTQADLAARLGLALRSLQRIEAGSVTTTDVLVHLAMALHVPIAALFEAPKSLARRRPGRPRRG